MDYTDYNTFCGKMLLTGKIPTVLCICERAITWPFSLLSCPRHCPPKIWGKSQFLKILDNWLLLNWITLDTVQCTLHSLLTEHYTLHTLHCELHITHCHFKSILHIAHCTVHTAEYTLKIPHTGDTESLNNTQHTDIATYRLKQPWGQFSEVMN